MKKLFYTFIFLVFTAFSIMAQSVAICGWDASGSSSVGDEVSFVLLRDFSAGEILYITEDEYSDATNNFNLTEGNLAYTVPAGGLLENDVLNIRETSDGVYSELCGSGGTVVGTGSWSLVADALGGSTDEIYIYSASNPASPQTSITEIHSFAWGAVNSIPTDQNPAADWPNAIVIAFNIGGGAGVNADFNARVNTTLPMLLSGANWTAESSALTLSCTNFTTQMVLPVDLINFDVSKKEEKVILDWSTATEINNDYFLIEHSSDGKHFVKIEQVNGAGNSELINHYNFIHKNPVNGFNYYRLQQVDYDGNFEYSDIVSVKYRNDINLATVYPNPFDQSITIQFPLIKNNYSRSNSRTIEIYDIYGILVHNERASLDESIVTLNLSNLIKGTYFLFSTDGHQTLNTLRIVK